MTSAFSLTAALISLGIVTACTDAGSRPVQQATTGQGADIAAGAFDAVELRGGGHVMLRYGNTERVRLVEGSTAYTSFHVEDRTLVINACNDNCPDRYELQIDITIPDIKAVAIDGGGHIESAPGFPAQNMITAAVNGGGHINLDNLNADNGTAAVHGGGHIQIHAKSMLTAAVDGGGAIRYTGNPRVTSAINGGGSIQAGSDTGD